MRDGDSLWRTIRADIVQNAEGRDSLAIVLISLIWSRGVQAIALYRLAHWCYLRRLRPISELLLRLSQLVYTVDIAYQAEIGPGFVLRHPVCIVIGSGCVIRHNVKLFQGVTLGNRFSGTATRPDGSPVIGDNVIIGAGAKVLGDLEVGAHSFIGANSVLTVSVPPQSVVVGSPARVVKIAGQTVAPATPDPLLAADVAQLQREVARLTQQLEKLTQDPYNGQA